MGLSSDNVNRLLENRFSEWTIRLSISNDDFLTQEIKTLEKPLHTSFPPQRIGFRVTHENRVFLIPLGLSPEITYRFHYVNGARGSIAPRFDRTSVYGEEKKARGSISLRPALLLLEIRSGLNNLSSHCRIIRI